MRIASHLLPAFGALLFTACAGSIYGEYTEPDERVKYAVDGVFTSVDASQYYRWVYVDLAGGTATLVDEYLDGSEDGVPAVWDFAMHRFDTKTNGGAALETSFKSIDALVASGAVPSGDFVPDERTDDKVAIDMTGMMTGDIVYAESDRNPELSKWMDVDMSGMPPVYTPSGRVYVLRTAGGTLAAIRMTGHRSASSVTGYISFEYICPLEF